VTPQGVLACAPAELDVGLCVANGQVFRWTPHERGWLGVDGPRVLWVGRDGDRILFATFPEAGRADWVRELFRLETPLDKVQRGIVEVEPDLAPVVSALPGLRVLRWHSPEECLFSFLCSVNNHIPRITSMIDALARSLGTPLALGLNRFPGRHEIAAAGEASLRWLGLGYRAKTLVGAATALGERAAGWLEGLRYLPYEEARSEMMSLPGVGRKVADCVCLLALGQDEAVPVDTHLWHACCERYYPEWRGRSLTQARYDEIGRRFRERFGRLAGWAHQYLFYDRLLSQGSRRARGRAVAGNTNPAISVS
jgi:N-glycosylase/DNA lyase